MIDRNRTIDEQEVKVHIIAGITSGLFRENLVIQEKPIVNTERAAARALFAFEDSGLDLRTHARQYGLLLNNAGRSAYAEKQYTGAKLAWQEAMQMRNTDIDSRLRLGIAAICTGDAPLAERALYGASIASIMHLDGIREMIRIFADHDRSTSGLEKAAGEIAERTANILNALGEARLAQGKYGPAARAFEKCLTFDPEYDGVSERLQAAYDALAQRRFTN